MRLAVESRFHDEIVSGPCANRVAVSQALPKGFLGFERNAPAQEDVFMILSSKMLRRIGIVAAASISLGAIALPGQAQMRQQMADKIATNAANSFVSKINGESCTQFAATMAQMKGKSGSSSSSSGMASKLKANPQARTDFVSIVGGPLLNKMIDCNMMPGGM
jgi:hypothetical protein